MKFLASLKLTSTLGEQTVDPQHEDPASHGSKTLLGAGFHSLSLHGGESAFYYYHLLLFFFFYISPLLNLQLIKSSPHLPPRDSWDRIQLPIVLRVG